jgi:cytidylate kinase
VFLTASEDARALRRAAEHSDADVTSTAASLRRRDYLDASRPTSPLRQAEDAVVIDATDLTLDEVVDAVCKLVLRRAGSVATNSDGSVAENSTDKVNQ